MESSVLQDIEEKISSSVPSDRVKRLKHLIKKDGLYDIIESILKECSAIEESLKFIPDIGGLADTSKEIEYKVRIVREFIANSLVELANDKGYMRSFFRSKSKVKKVKDVLLSTIEELKEAEKELLVTVKGTLAKAIKSLSLPADLKDEVNKINKIDDLRNLSELWNLIEEKIEASGLRKEQAPKTRGTTIVTDEVLQETLTALSELMESEKELELRGCNFVALSEVLALKDLILEWLSKNVGRESSSASHIISHIKRVAEDSKTLLLTSKELLNLRSSLERVKREIMGKVESKAPQLTDTISMVGVSSPRLPCTIANSKELAGLRYEVSKLRSLVDLLEELDRELDLPLDGLDISPERLSYRTEVDFLRSLIEMIRSFRLSHGLPSSAYSLPGLMAELLSLYPKWREYVREYLKERGSIRISELTFIPESWRDWFLRNLEEEGGIEVKGDLIKLKVTSPEAEKLQMKFDFLKDTYNDAKAIFNRMGIDDKYMEELENKMKLLKEAKGDEAKKIAKEIESMIDKALEILRGTIDEEDEAGSHGSSSSWQIDFNT